MERECIKCGKSFSVPPSRARAQFCSRSCCSKVIKNAKKAGWFIQGGYLRVTGFHGHPSADKRGRVFQHRMVMSIHLNRPLLDSEIVHH
jgi:hypothetical protein